MNPDALQGAEALLLPGARTGRDPARSIKRGPSGCRPRRSRPPSASGCSTAWSTPWPNTATSTPR